MNVQTEQALVSFDDVEVGDGFLHNDQAFIKTAEAGTAVALDTGDVDDAFTGANMVTAAVGAEVVMFPSPDFHP